MIKIQKRKNHELERGDEFVFTTQIHKENTGIIG